MINKNKWFYLHAAWIHRPITTFGSSVKASYKRPLSLHSSVVTALLASMMAQKEEKSYFGLHLFILHLSQDCCAGLISTFPSSQVIIYIIFLRVYACTPMLKRASSVTRRDVTPALKVSSKAAGEILSPDRQTEVGLISCRAITSHWCTALLLAAALSCVPLCAPNVTFHPQSRCVLPTPMSELPARSNDTLPSRHFVSNKPFL